MPARVIVPSQVIRTVLDHAALPDPIADMIRELADQSERLRARLSVLEARLGIALEADSGQRLLTSSELPPLDGGLNARWPRRIASDIELVTKNRRALFDYAIEEKFEAGLVLVGSEVKSLRAGKLDIGDAYVAVEAAEKHGYGRCSWRLCAMNSVSHEPRRPLGCSCMRARSRD